MKKIEELARAIDRGAFITQCDDGTEEEACGCSECEVRREEARTNARAAIEAMRKPTQEMLDRGWEARSVPRHCWENMIDEALK